MVGRFFDDLSVEQTAEALGCAAGTVKALTHQGLSDLRAMLGALVRTADHVRTELIFDAKTYAYLGDNIVVDAYSVRGPNWVIDSRPGDVLDRSAILRVAVVDQAGRLP